MQTNDARAQRLQAAGGREIIKMIEDAIFLPWPLKHADWPIYNLSVLRGSLLTHPSRSQGRRNTPPPHTLCIEMEFYADTSCESRCNNEIKVRAHFYQI